MWSYSGELIVAQFCFWCLPRRAGRLPEQSWTSYVLMGRSVWSRRCIQAARWWEGLQGPAFPHAVSSDLHGRSGGSRSFTPFAHVRKQAQRAIS